MKSFWSLWVNAFIGTLYSLLQNLWKPNNRVPEIESKQIWGFKLSLIYIEMTSGKIPTWTVIDMFCLLPIGFNSKMGNRVFATLGPNWPTHLSSIQLQLNSWGPRSGILITYPPICSPPHPSTQACKT